MYLLCVKVILLRTLCFIAHKDINRLGDAFTVHGSAPI